MRYLFVSITTDFGPMHTAIAAREDQTDEDAIEELARQRGVALISIDRVGPITDRAEAAELGARF